MTRPIISLTIRFCKNEIIRMLVNPVQIPVMAANAHAAMSVFAKPSNPTEMPLMASELSTINPNRFGLICATDSHTDQ